MRWLALSIMPGTSLTLVGSKRHFVVVLIILRQWLWFNIANQ